MRWFLLTVCGGLVLAGAVVAATATSPRRLAAAPAASAMPLTADQAELGKSIRAYLLANPEVLVDAMQELERNGSGIFWGNVKLDVISYPDSSLRMTIYTLSARPELPLG